MLLVAPGRFVAVGAGACRDVLSPLFCARAFAAKNTDRSRARFSERVEGPIAAAVTVNERVG